MGWQNIFTRNIGWKITSLLLATLIWFTIDTIKSGGNSTRFQDQALTENKLNNSAIIPLAPTQVSTNRVNVIQAYDIRVLKLPEDPTQYVLEPAQVTLTLGSDANPAPDLTSPVAVKVLLDPSDIPFGINETNKQVRVLVPEGTIIKGINPKEVKVTRVVAPPSPSAEEQSAGEDSAESGGEKNEG